MSLHRYTWSDSRDQQEELPEKKSDRSEQQFTRRVELSARCISFYSIITDTPPISSHKSLLIAHHLEERSFTTRWNVKLAYVRGTRVIYNSVIFVRCSNRIAFAGKRGGCVRVGEERRGKGDKRVSTARIIIPSGSRLGVHASIPWHESTCARYRPSDDDWLTGGATILTGVERAQPLNQGLRSFFYLSFTASPDIARAERESQLAWCSRCLSPTNREEPLGWNGVIERKPLEKYEKEREREIVEIFILYFKV